MITTRRTAAMAGALVLVAGFGCGDGGPAGPEGGGTGIQFDFDGERSGLHKSDGPPSIASNGLPAVGPWAIARADSLGGMVVASFEPIEATAGNLFILQLHPIRTGAFTPCGIVGGEGCHGRFILGVDTRDLSAVQAWYEISEGSVTLSEAGPDRVRGTFSATFTNQDGGGTLTVEGGVVDVAFSEDVSLANGLACLVRNLQAGTNEPC